MVPDNLVKANLPGMGKAKGKYKPVMDAPGRYVLQKKGEVMADLKGKKA